MNVSYITAKTTVFAIYLSVRDYEGKELAKVHLMYVYSSSQAELLIEEYSKGNINKPLALVNLIKSLKDWYTIYKPVIVFMKEVA